jgi:hypothetical protein
MRQTRPPFPVVQSPTAFSKDAVIIPCAPVCQPIPAPVSGDRPAFADLGYTPAQVEQLRVMSKDAPGMTVMGGGAFALPMPSWLSQVNAHDVRPPYQTGDNPDLDLFLEVNCVDFAEGTPLCELHRRLQETFTAEDEADLIEEGLELAFKPHQTGDNPDLDLFLEVNRVDFTEGTPLCELHHRLRETFTAEDEADLIEEGMELAFKPREPELQEQVDHLNERLHQSFEQETAAFTRALIAEAQALPTTDPRRAGAMVALRQVAPPR